MITKCLTACVAASIAWAAGLGMSRASEITTTLTLDTPGVNPLAIVPGTALNFTVWGDAASLSGDDVGIGGYDLGLTISATGPGAVGAASGLGFPQYLGTDIWPITVGLLPADVVGSFLPIGPPAWRQNLGAGSPAEGVNGVPLFTFMLPTADPGAVPVNVTLSLVGGVSAGSTLGFSMLQSLPGGTWAQRGTGAGDTVTYDSLVFTVVPEPGTLTSLTLLAAAGLLYARRYKITRR